jgi:hypothetical protein
LDKIEHHRLGVLDIISIASQQNACIVYPTHGHALAHWPIVREAMFDRHDRERVKPSRTSLLMWRTKTLLRLWVPYEREPTRAMDWEHLRAGFTLISPYDRTHAR